MAALREALGEYLLPSHNWCGKRAEFSWSLKWLKVLFSFTSCWFWKCQNESTCLFITLFQYCLERSLLIFCRRYSGSGRSYLCNMCLTLINQLELSSVFTRSWRRAIWCSIVEGSIAIFMNVVNILMSIWASMVFAPTKAKTATLAVLSGRFWSCFNTFLWYSSKSVRSFFLISRSSIPCRSLGRIDNTMNTDIFSIARRVIGLKVHVLGNPWVVGWNPIARQRIGLLGMTNIKGIWHIWDWITKHAVTKYAVTLYKLLTGDEGNIWYVGPEDKMLPEAEGLGQHFVFRSNISYVARIPCQ